MRIKSFAFIYDLAFSIKVHHQDNQSWEWNFEWNCFGLFFCFAFLSKELIYLRLLNFCLKWAFLRLKWLFFNMTNDIYHVFKLCFCVFESTLTRFSFVKVKNAGIWSQCSCFWCKSSLRAILRAVESGWDWKRCISFLIPTEWGLVS